MTACATTGDSPIPRPESAQFGRLEAGLRAVLSSGPRRVAVAYSGGLDSTALLHFMGHRALALGVEVHALHVHHGLSPRAGDWLSHCQVQCARWGLPLDAAHVQLSLDSPEGIEAQARRLRYAALAELAHQRGCEQVLLAHHQDDQAETFLLQALRGAGVAGLAAMPQVLCREGLRWLRPWLQESRALLQAYVHHHGLSHVEDESNLDVRYARNGLRLDVLPVMAKAFPGASVALGHVVTQMQEAQACLEELAEVDLQAVSVERGAALDVVAWATLSVPRRSNALRAWLKQRLGVPAPRTLVQRLMLQLRPGAGPQQWPAPAARLALYRDVLRVRPVIANALKPALSAVSPWVVTGPGRYRLPFCEDELVVVSTEGAAGVPLAALQALSWRVRSGGEQFQQHARGVPRSLKKAFQAAAVPAWQRGLPLLYSGETILYVPGLGLDARAVQVAGEGRVRFEWCPARSPQDQLAAAG